MAYYSGALKYVKNHGRAPFALALAVFFMVQISALWLPLLAKDGMQIQICTTQGVKTVSVSDDFSPYDNKEPEHVDTNEHCPMCLVRSASLLTAETITAQPLRLVSTNIVFWTEHSAGKTDAFDFVRASRAPPVFS